MIKHLFCDLDGTLLKDFHYFDETDIKALQEAQAQGITISIATGRLDYEIKKIMDRYQYQGFRISQNGAVIFDRDDKPVYEKALAYPDIKLIVEALKNQPVILFFQTPDTYYVEKKLPVIVDFEKKQDLITYVENPDIIKQLKNEKIITVSTWAAEADNLSVKNHLDKVLPKHIACYLSSKYTLDITLAENSKGNAIEILADKYQLDLSEIAVIGDSHNDLSMFDVVPASFVIDTAHDDVKARAKWVVKNVEEAVRKILK